jgi:hypothetical protein
MGAGDGIAAHGDSDLRNRSSLRLGDSGAANDLCRLLFSGPSIYRVQSIFVRSIIRKSKAALALVSANIRREQEARGLRIVGDSHTAT